MATDPGPSNPDEEPVTLYLTPIGRHVVARALIALAERESLTRLERTAAAWILASATGDPLPRPPWDPGDAQVQVAR